MRYFLLVLFLLLGRLEAKEDAQVGSVHLYGYLGREWLPFADVELLSVQPGLVRFRTSSQEIEHSGRFTVTQAATKKEKKWWQFGSSDAPEHVAMVVLYPFATLEMAPFRDVDIYEKREGFIVFEIGSTRYTHCGRYSIHR